MKKTKRSPVPSLNVSSNLSSAIGSGAARLDYPVLNRITERAFFMALKMIDVANSRPISDKGEPKVGGHASACASSQHILAAIHLVLRQPEDYLACKPHVSPMDHALNYLLHNFRNPEGELLDSRLREKVMHHLRHYSPEGEPVFQSYHAESDPDSYRYFPSGSVGIPPVNAIYMALGYDFAKHHGFEVNENPSFWCLMGDSEFREGSLMEAMPDAGERELGNVIWIVDYNRQNLDGTRISNEVALRGSDADRMMRLAEANGWEAYKLKHGRKRERLFASPGGEAFQKVLDDKFTDFEFQAVLSANDKDVTAKALIEKSPELSSWIKRHGPETVHEAFMNLGGHDLESLVEVLAKAKNNSKRPSLIVAYTVKGWGLRCQAMSGNHSALPEEDELLEMAQRLGVPKDHPFEEFAPGSAEESFLLDRRSFLVDGIQEVLLQVQARQKAHLQEAKNIDWPKDFDITALKFNPVAHTQWMWGQIAAKLDRLARGQALKEGSSDTLTEKEWKKVARFFLTMAPDVGSSTNTSPNMNGKLYGEVEQLDFETKYGVKDEKAPDVMPKISERSGHLRFEIAEGNCMSAAGSLGKFFHFTGVPIYPSMTIYDFFIKRAHDQFYYNLYWHSSFATIGTPSGVTLAAEGAQHSWKSDFQIPHCVTWEPCFAKELEWILAETLRRHFTWNNENREATLVRCVTKGLVQKDFIDRLKRQKRFKESIPSEGLTIENESSQVSIAEAEIWETVRQEALQGAYALIDYRGYDDYVPGDNVVHLFAMGALGGEAIAASDALNKKGIFANVFIVTSPDLLLGHLGYETDYAHLKALGVDGQMYLKGKISRELRNEAEWLSLQGGRVPVVSVHDGEAGLLDNIGSIIGVKQEALAVRKTSKSGTTRAIYHFHHLDAESICEAAEKVLKESAEEELHVHPSVFDFLSK